MSAGELGDGHQERGTIERRLGQRDARRGLLDLVLTIDRIVLGALLAAPGLAGEDCGQQQPGNPRPRRFP
jgi:hypothetical protein